MTNNPVYYLVYRLYSTFTDEKEHRELVGWTDNEYIIKSFIQCANDADDEEYIVVTTDNLIEEYREQFISNTGMLDDELCRETIIDKLYGELLDCQLKIITSKTGMYYGITTDKCFQELVEYSDTLYDLMSDLINSIRALLVISKYAHTSEMKSFLNYILIKYVSHLIESYRNGEIMNSCIDVIHLLMQDGYIYEIR